MKKKADPFAVAALLVRECSAKDFERAAKALAALPSYVRLDGGAAGTRGLTPQRAAKILRAGRASEHMRRVWHEELQLVAPGRVALVNAAAAAVTKLHTAILATREEASADTTAAVETARFTAGGALWVLEKVSVDRIEIEGWPYAAPTTLETVTRLIDVGAIVAELPLVATALRRFARRLRAVRSACPHASARLGC